MPAYLPAPSLPLFAFALCVTLTFRGSADTKPEREIEVGDEILGHEDD
jgi:hypothetical protein